jgi:hypothetical protein
MASSTGADQAGGGDDALGVQHVEQFAPALVQRADQLAGLDAHVVEEHAARIERAGAQLVDRRVREPGARRRS